MTAGDVEMKEQPKTTEEEKKDEEKEKTPEEIAKMSYEDIKEQLKQIDKSVVGKVIPIIVVSPTRNVTIFLDASPTKFFSISLHFSNIL